MISTLQSNLTDTTYNGWANYETWNVALWLGNDAGLYDLARRCDGYRDFVDYLEACSFNRPATPDGVSYRDPNLNVIELDQLIEEL